MKNKFPKIAAAVVLCLAFLLCAAYLTHQASANNGDIQVFQQSGTNNNVPPVPVIIPASTNALLVTGSGGVPTTLPNVSVLSGSLTAGSLPAALPLTIYYSLSGTGAGTGAVYIKLTGTGTAGWWLATSGTGPAQ
jgi:hypothetical protein